jgi:glycosyltransferase involved in cell wall biosynthesis
MARSRTLRASFRMRITLTIPSLLCGGAERAATNISNYWAKRGWMITILTLNHPNQPSFYDLDPNVTHVDIGYHREPGLASSDRLLEQSLSEIKEHCSEVERALIEEESARLHRLRRAIIATVPQAIISLEELTNIRVLLACSGLALPVIVSERGDPGHRLPGHERWATLRSRVYPSAVFLVTLTEDVSSHYRVEMGNRVRVIPNMVLPSPVLTGEPGSTGHKSGRILMAMGRLSPVKGFDSLLRAFALIAFRHPSWSLEIWGDGPLRPDLEGLANELGIGERVRFPGFTRRPYDALSRGDLFVVSSDFEGFPNALCEAMAFGLPVVSFDCPSGPRNIIRDGIDGVLVPPANVPALAETLDGLLGSDAERSRLAARAPEVVERFSAEKIMGMWECLLHDAIRVAAHSASSREPGA